MKPLETLLNENESLEEYIFDEIGKIENYLGWYGFLIVAEEYYIVHRLEDSYSVKKYKNKKAISKAWDHICNKYETWYRQHFYQQIYTPDYD